MLIQAMLTFVSYFRRHPQKIFKLLRMSFTLREIELEIIRERMILLKYLKILLDIDLKIILLNHQNNYDAETWWMIDTAKSFDNQFECPA